MTSNIMLTLAFLAGVLAVYYLTPKAGRQWILLAASLLFYLSADPRMLLLSGGDRKSTRLNSSHSAKSRMPSSA